MKKQKLILTVGLPASGKTTWTYEQIKKSNGNIKNVNRDDLREMIHGKLNFSREREKTITAVQEKAVDTFVAQGYDVIISDTNLNKGVQARWLEYAANKDLDIVFEKSFCDVSHGECIRRDKRREHRGERFVGQNVIMGMYNKYKKEEFSGPSNNRSLPSCVICDIDGTLAHMVKRSPFDWSKVGNDSLDFSVYSILKAMKASGHKIIMMSGRDGSCKEKTEIWLKENNVEYDFLFMREAGNNEKDSILKKRLFADNILNKFHVLCVIDDRDQVVDMWRGLGLKVLQVGYGDF